MKGEPRSGQATSKPADNQPKPVQRPATAATAAAKVTVSLVDFFNMRHSVFLLAVHVCSCKFLIICSILFLDKKNFITIQNSMKGFQYRRFFI